MAKKNLYEVVFCFLDKDGFVQKDCNDEMYYVEYYYAETCMGAVSQMKAKVKGNPELVSIKKFEEVGGKR